MPEAFYPFVENGQDGSSPQDEGQLVVRHSARIAVFDDPSAAPRVVVIEPSDIRTYLEEITKTVTSLAQEQGGGIPFTVIREVVENLIHAYFMEPTISILDGGNTIRFSDQGPGINDKRRALEFGTTSATAEMKRYIRGVGSGLPYAQQWLEDKGGSLVVEDNIHQGTVVTVSLGGAPAQNPAEPPMEQGVYQQQQPYQQGNVAPQQQGGWYPQPYQQQPYPPSYQQTGYQQPSYQQAYPQPYPQQGGMPQVPYQQPYGSPWPQGYPQQPGWGTAPQGYAPQYPGVPQGAPQTLSQPTISERGRIALEYLRTHESVGPRDLNAQHPLSEATWSRELKQLEDQGLIAKQGGQKRRLTPLGRQALGI